MQETDNVLERAIAYQGASRLACWADSTQLKLMWAVMAQLLVKPVDLGELTLLLTDLLNRDQSKLEWT